MYILEIIDASSLSASAKADLRETVERTCLALNENDRAIANIFKTKSSMNERQYAQRLAQSQPGAKRDELIMTQHAWRNEYANSIYRAQGAQRCLQQLGKSLHEQIAPLDVSQPSLRGVAVAVKSLISRCIAAGGDKPNAVVRELTTVADIKQERIEDSVREIFSQKKSGKGAYALINFSSLAIMVTEADSPQMRALHDATIEAERLFYKVRATFEECNAAKAKLNLPQFVERLEKAQRDGDTVKFEQVTRLCKAAEADFFVAASHALAVTEAYQPQIDKFAALIKAAADTVTDLRGNKQLVTASACIGAWHWLHEMEWQLDVIWRFHDPRKMLAHLNFDVDGYLAADLLK
jgi:hypothetical protein